MKTTLCDKCNEAISNCNYKRHYESCDGTPKPKSVNKGECKYCHVKFELDDKPKGWMANHSRWCYKNPRAVEDKLKISLTNSESLKNGRAKALSKESRMKATEKIKQHHANGVYDSVYEYNRLNPTMLGKKHSEESKLKMSEKFRTLTHRRLQKKCVDYRKKDGSIVKLDSSWEVVLAERLDNLNIDWIRPEPIKWYDLENKHHNYFADFYLPKYDVYLDPKNPHVFKVQAEKIEILNKTYSNIIWIRTLEECKNFDINALVSEPPSKR